MKVQTTDHFAKCLIFSSKFLFNFKLLIRTYAVPVIPACGWRAGILLFKIPHPFGFDPKGPLRGSGQVLKLTVRDDKYGNRLVLY